MHDMIIQLKNRWTGLNVSKGKKAKDRESLQHEIERAKKEWNNAQQNLNFAEKERDIDHFIYLIECTEKRYMYLMRKARVIKEGERNV